MHARVLTRLFVDIDHECAECKLYVNATPNGACAHHVMVSRVQRKPFWIATHLYPSNYSTEWQNGVNYGVHMYSHRRHCHC